MYEIIVTINGKEFVADTCSDLGTASAAVHRYRLRGLQASYRAQVVPATTDGSQNARPPSSGDQSRVA